jgi:hypothetical protein
MRITMNARSPLAVVCLILASCGGGNSETSSSSVSAEVDPCTLLTAVEIEATMGVVPGEPERPQSFACQWPNPGSPFPVAYLGVSRPNIGSWEEYREQLIEEGFGDPDADGAQVDIGRFGFYMQDVSMIQVQTDSAVLITLNVRGATREQIVDLASKAVARLR